MYIVHVSNNSLQGQGRTQGSKVIWLIMCLICVIPELLKRLKNILWSQFIQLWKIHLSFIALHCSNVYVNSRSSFLVLCQLTKAYGNLYWKLRQKISFDLELEIQKIKRKLFLMLSNFLQSCYIQMVKLSSKKQLKNCRKIKSRLIEKSNQSCMKINSKLFLLLFYYTVNTVLPIAVDEHSSFYEFCL